MPDRTGTPPLHPPTPWGKVQPEGDRSLSAPTDESPAVAFPRRGWRILRAVLGVVGVWIALDLVCGLRLPFAVVLEQIAFAAVVEVPVYAIYAGPILIPALGLLAGMAWLTRTRWPAGWIAVGEVAQGAIWAVAATVAVVGILKLRALCLPLLAAVGAATIFWTRRPAPRRLGISVAATVVAVPLLVAVIQLHAFVWSDALWRLLVDRVNEGGSPPRMMILPVVLAGIGLAVVLLGAIRFDALTTDRLVPRWLPRAAVGALLVGQIGHAAAFAGPYFSLWDEPLPDGLTRLDTERSRVHPEAFRLAISDDGRWLLVVYRQSTRLARFDLRSGVVRWVEPSLPDEGTLENVVWDEARRRFLVSFELDDPAATDWLVAVDDDARTTLIEVPDHGWIASMVLDGDRLVLGYEARPTLAVFDLALGEFADVHVIAALGDVEEAVVVDGAVFTIPLHHPWGLHLSEVDLAAGAVHRRLLIGGANQDLEAVGSKLLVGRYYASRIEVVDRVAWLRERSLAAGFGVRAVAADAERGLVLSGGQFEGSLRVHDLGTGAELSRIPSCGYVKDLVLHDGAAFFAGLCGVYRVDLDAIPGVRR